MLIGTQEISSFGLPPVQGEGIERVEWLGIWAALCLLVGNGNPRLICDYALKPGSICGDCRGNRESMACLIPARCLEHPASCIPFRSLSSGPFSISLLAEDPQPLNTTSTQRRHNICLSLDDVYAKPLTLHLKNTVS